MIASLLVAAPLALAVGFAISASIAARPARRACAAWSS